MARKWFGMVLVCLAVIGLLPLAGLAEPEPPVEYVKVEIPRQVFQQSREVTLTGERQVAAYQVTEASPGEYVAGTVAFFPPGTTGELVESQCTREYAAVTIGGRLYYVPWASMSLGDYVVHSYTDGVIIVEVPRQPPEPPPEQQPD